jgi:hypothetical protein
MKVSKIFMRRKRTSREPHEWTVAKNLSNTSGYSKIHCTIPTSRNQVHIKLFPEKRKHPTCVQYMCKIKIFK